MVYNSIEVSDRLPRLFLRISLSCFLASSMCSYVNRLAAGQINGVVAPWWTTSIKWGLSLHNDRDRFALKYSRDQRKRPATCAVIGI